MIQKNRFLYVLFLLLTVITFSCQKDEDVVERTSALSIVDSSIPTQELSVDGGTITVQVDWAYNQWKTIIGGVVEGTEFITQVTPTYGGDVEKGQSITSVTVTYKASTSYAKNKQYVIIKSYSDSKADTLVLVQAAKALQPINLTINPSTTYQTISGFGGANMIWGSDYLSTTEMDLAFGTSDASLGLSLMRVRLSSVKADWAGLVASVKKANSLGVKVLATPWSPPAVWKSNNSVNGGGHLLEANYADYVAYVNEFIQYMSTNGATIDVVSIQNEPDWLAPYEGCEYTTTQMFNFVKNNAGAIVGAKVAAAESLNSNQSYTSGILNDATAVNNIDIVAGHLYGSGLKAYPLAEQKGKEIWMTEHLYNLDSGNNPGNWTETTNPATIWDETLLITKDISMAMSYSWNAYIYWYIRRYYSFLGDGERGTTRGTVLKRGYAMSQFSKFVRPGYVRIATQIDNSATGLKISAFKGDNKVVVVVIVNAESYAANGITLNLPDAISSAVAYTTSLDKNREKQVLTPNDKKVSLDILPKSVTTIVIN